MAFWNEPVRKKKTYKKSKNGRRIRIRGMPLLAIRKMIESPKTPQRLKNFWVKELHRKGIMLNKVI